MSKGNPIQLDTAEYLAEKWLAQYRLYCASDAQIYICGSIRRKEKMIRDIDILVIDAASHGTLQHGAKFEGVELNIYCVAPEHTGAGLLFLTGNAQFNITLRGLAKRKGMKLNRYGLYRDGKLIASETEEDIFQALGMDYVPPKGRGSGEKDAGMRVASRTQVGVVYDVYTKDIHGYNFCNCKGFKYRRTCSHLELV